MHEDPLGPVQAGGCVGKPQASKGIAMIGEHIADDAIIRDHRWRRV